MVEVQRVTGRGRPNDFSGTPIALPLQQSTVPHKIPAEAVHAARVDGPPGNEHPRFGEKASRLQFGDGRADRVLFW
jgi:hypothetical protein